MYIRYFATIFSALHVLFILAVEPIVEQRDPCEPNPCGQNALPPRRVGDECKCSCLPDMKGFPPNCRPECVINSDCPSDKACISRKCQDPCPGLCGVNAYCRVRNHIPICVCNRNYQGDPFSQCTQITSKFRAPGAYTGVFVRGGWRPFPHQNQLPCIHAKMYDYNFLLEWGVVAQYIKNWVN